MATKYDLDKIRESYERFGTRAQAERYSYERSWFQNVLFFCGIQWIVYNPQQRKWTPRRIAKWVPRPVTNKFASVAASMIQVLSQRQPTVRATAGSDDPADIAAATIADRVFDVLLKEADAKEARHLGAAWLTLTGTAIFHPCYDNDPMHGTTMVQHAMCQQCQQVYPPDAVQGSDVCPTCQQPLIPAMNPDGSPIGEELPTGKLNIEVFSPFETYMDLEGGSSKRRQQITTRRRYPLDVIRRKFNRFDLEADNNSNAGGAIGLNLLRAIAYAAGNSISGTGVASGRSLGDDQSITVDCQWVRPCTDFPEGLVSYWANNELLNEKVVKEGIPYRNKEGNPLWPWHIAKFDEVPGRAFGKTPLDDVAPKQEQRNKLESLIQLIVTRAANPVWLIPKGLGVTEITGEPGQMVEGNWAMDPRQKPERIPGENIPTSLIAWLEKIDNDIDNVARIYDVMRGQAPTGVTAGTALRLLLEKAQTSFQPVAERNEDCWEGIFQDLLCIFQQFGVDKRLAKIEGPGNTWEIRQFSKADIQGNIDIRVEAGSSLPKSLVGEQAMIQDLVTLGVIMPQLPEVQYKILERFGVTNLLGDTDENIKAAQRENWDFQNQDVVPVFDLLIDLHPTHLQIHKQLALKSDFKLWPEEKQAVWRQHILEHMTAMAPPMMASTGPEQGDGQQPGAQKSNKPEKGQDNEKGMPPDITQAPMPGGIM